MAISLYKKGRSFLGSRSSYSAGRNSSGCSGGMEPPLPSLLQICSHSSSALCLAFTLMICTPLSACVAGGLAWLHASWSSCTKACSDIFTLGTLGLLLSQQHSALCCHPCNQAVHLCPLMQPVTLINGVPHACSSRTWQPDDFLLPAALLSIAAS